MNNPETSLGSFIPTIDDPRCEVLLKFVENIMMAHLVTGRSLRGINQQVEYYLSHCVNRNDSDIIRGYLKEKGIDFAQVSGKINEAFLKSIDTDVWIELSKAKRNADGSVKQIK